MLGCLTLCCHIGGEQSLSQKGPGRSNTGDFIWFPLGSLSGCFWQEMSSAPTRATCVCTQRQSCRDGRSHPRSVPELVTQLLLGTSRGGCTVGVAEAPGIVPIPTASLLWFFICLFQEHALGGELAVNPCRGSPFSHLNLKFPVTKRSHGNGGKLSPFLSPSEPCPANTHNAGWGQRLLPSQSAS